MADRESLTDDDLIDILRREERASSNYWDSALSEHYDEALNYYNRRPYGDEQEGSSKVVTSEFADVIESLMPGLMRVFTASDNLATFVPAAPGQERWAREASEYVPHVLMRENDGFRIVHTLIKDALMYRLGGTTVDLEEYEDTRVEQVQGARREVIDLRLGEIADDTAEITVDLTEDPAPPMPPPDAMAGGMAPLMPAPTYSGTITITAKRKRVVVENIAPEDIRFTPTARSEDKASFLGFLKKVTASELRKQGLSDDDIDALQSDRAQSTEDTERSDGAIIGAEERDRDGDSERPLWLVVAYVRADMNGDGVSEMLRVVYAHAGGTAGRIIEQAEWEGPASIALASPILMSHQIVGRSLFDQTQDLQQIGSVITRGLLDNIYQVNRPRPVVTDQVLIDTLLDWVPGSPIRLKAGTTTTEGHVNWVKVPTVMADALTGLEHFKTVREDRTGVTRYNQGQDADSLNKTLGGLDRIMSASQQRQDLIARVFAETAMRRLYRLIYRAIKSAAAGQMQYWNGKAFAQVDPTQWPDEMELTINVVGIGNREQSIQHLNMIAMLQEKLVALQGGSASGPFVTAENVATTANKMAETLGYKSPGMFFQAPEAVTQAVQAEQGQPPKPNPEMAAAEGLIAVERAKAESEIMLRQQKNAADIALERERAAARMQIMREEAALEMELERQKAALAAELKSRELADRSASRTRELDQKAEIDVLKTLASAAGNRAAPPEMPQ